MDQLKGGGQPRSPDNRRDSQSKINRGNLNKANSRPKKKVNVESKHSELIDNLIGEELEEPVNIDDYEEVLLASDRDKRNLLHRIILRLKTTVNATSEILAVVDRIVIDDPKLLTNEDGNGNIPLLEAAESKVDILFRVISLVITDAVRGILKAPCNDHDKSCALKSVKLHKRLVEKCRRDTSGEKSTSGKNDKQHEFDDIEAPEVTEATEVKADNQDACLHAQLDLEKLEKWDAELREELSRGLSQTTKTKWTCLQSLIDANNFDPGVYIDHNPTIPLESFSLLLKLCPDHLFVTAAQKGFSPLQIAIQLYKESAIDYSHLFLVIKELVERSPDSIYFEARDEAGCDKGKTAYRLLKELDMDNGNVKGHEKEEFESNERNKSLQEAEEMLKKACIGLTSMERELEEKLKFLYWDDAKLMRKIGLNLLSESAQIDKEYVSIVRKKSGMHFETILASVKLPYWSPKNRKAHIPCVADYQAEHMSIGSADPYIEIFEWLWESKVRKIYTVEVDDTGPVPHSNDAIRRSLRQKLLEGSPEGSYRDFAVEVFKWKKYDLCSDTICAAVPNAKEVHLYSSGNTAVLRGWACSSGLHDMENLRSLRIEIYPRNANDEADCRAYEENFKIKLAENCRSLTQNDIEIKYPNSDSEKGGTCGTGQKNPEGAKGPDRNPPIDETPSQDDWLDQMEPFKKFVKDISQKVPEEKRPKVKVAVLDNGVSLNSLTLNGGKGETFRVDNVEYCVGPCSHGTKMVECIRKLCPDAELYVARLDDSGLAEKQKFTTESCYKALAWARKMDVDIISMSWSFKKKGLGQDEGEDNFVKELSLAVAAKDVILFASLPDKGATSTITEYSPVGEKDIIRIGSATMFGEETKEIIFAPRDFLLPGEEITTSTGESDKGSSFATAYAAGLAALVLQCLKAHKALEDHYNDHLKENEPNLGLKYDDKHVITRLKEAATMDGMRKIFKVLSTMNANDTIPEKGFFVRPYKALKNSFGTDDSTKISYLRNIGPKILPLD